MRSGFLGLLRCPRSRCSAQWPYPRRLELEELEGRLLLAATVLQTNLVSDLPGVAQQMDPNLVNPWGIAESDKSFFWISDNNAGVSTLYDTQGNPQSLVVRIPTPPDPTGASGAPTGAVFNIAMGSGAFPIPGTTPAAPAVFLFATEDGTIVGWNHGTQAVIKVDNSGNNFTNPDPNQQTGAVYKGLAIATDGSGVTRLYAANFRSGKVEVYNTSFMPATLPTGAFTDPNLPQGYAPFDIQELGGKIYVTYALQNATRHDDVAGPHHGFVDVFNLDGTPGLAHDQMRLISGGPLDSPWGLALAPSSFGSLAGDLLVGNFGNGHINVFNPNNGTFLGELKDPDGEPIVIDGLWALKVGNGVNGGDPNKVYFTAGLFGETHGLFGSLTPVDAGSPEGPAEGQMVQAALDLVQLDLTTFLTDSANGASQTTLRQDLHNLQAAQVQLIKSEILFAADQIQDSDPKAAAPHFARGPDLDALDEVFADLGGPEHHRH
jgi:uncharacterized protein (TIGR03118 family)